MRYSDARTRRLWEPPAAHVPPVPAATAPQTVDTNFSGGQPIRRRSSRAVRWVSYALAIADAARTWQEIRAVRARPTGLAADDLERRAVFTASLQQAQELAVAAASTASYATKPLPLFYALSQGMRAASAAWVEEAWRIHGHGATVVTQRPLMQTVIKPRPTVTEHHRDCLSTLQMLDGHDPMAKPFTLEALWAATPETPQIELAGRAPASLRLHVSPYPRGIEEATSRGRILLGVEGLSADTPDDELARALEPYPSLAGAESARPYIDDALGQFLTNQAQVKFDRHGRILVLSYDEWIDSAPVLTWPLDSPTGEAMQALYEDLAPVGVESSSNTRMVFPAIGGVDHPSPYGLWWTLLLSLSSLVRYEPDLWSEAIDVDTSPVAVPLEQLCDYCEWFVPALLLGKVRDTKPEP